MSEGRVPLSTPRAHAHHWGEPFHCPPRALHELVGTGAIANTEILHYNVRKSQNANVLTTTHEKTFPASSTDSYNPSRQQAPTSKAAQAGAYTLCLKMRAHNKLCSFAAGSKLGNVFMMKLACNKKVTNINTMSNIRHTMHFNSFWPPGGRWTAEGSVPFHPGAVSTCFGFQCGWRTADRSAVMHLKAVKSDVKIQLLTTSRKECYQSDWHQTQ